MLPKSILNIMVQSDFKPADLGYRICDACAASGAYHRNRVNYMSLNKSEGGRFDYANVGLCHEHFAMLQRASQDGVER